MRVPLGIPVIFLISFLGDGCFSSYDRLHLQQHGHELLINFFKIKGLEISNHEAQRSTVMSNVMHKAMQLTSLNVLYIKLLFS